MKEKIKEQIEKLKQKGVKCRYDLLIEINAMLAAEDVPILLSELNAVSGYSARFLYGYNFPEAYNCSLDFIVSNLKNIVGITLFVSNVRYKNFLNSLEPPFVVYPENFLVSDLQDGTFYGFKGVFAEEIRAEQLAGGSVIRFEANKFDRKSLYSIGAFEKFAHLLKEEFFTDRIVICGRSVLSGKKALHEFAETLRDASVSFRVESKEGEKNSPWFSEAVYPQWSAINGTIAYLLGLHHFVERKLQDDMSKAIRHFEDALTFWKEFDRLVGKKSFISPNKAISMQNRRRAANALLKVSAAYERGIEVLFSVLDSIKNK